MSKEHQHAVAADFLFDGAELHRKAAVVIDGQRIIGAGHTVNLPKAIPVRMLPSGAWLAPGFIDVQVNGGGDVLFNDKPTAEGIAAIAAAHRKFGTTGLLPTLISDSTEKMRAAIDAVEQIAERELSVLGIHLEGPFLSPDKPGVHNLRAIRPPGPNDREMLTAPRKTVRLVTLAPEQVPTGFIAELTNAGVRVSLGHSMASYAQTRAAMQEGLRGFTHLFNAMRPLASRDPGPIAAALESPEVWFGLIVDGVHVDPAVLRVALRGAGQPILVTDAMPPVGGRRSRFMLDGEEINLVDGRCTRGDGTLAGAALDMAGAVRNCVSLLGAPLEAALRFASTNPANFLGLGHRLGRLAPGYRADMVAFEPTDIEVIETWVAGNSSARQETESASPKAARQSVLSSRSN
jgi:N-acetylglucosamine-6-phosphate deacetylase